MRNKIKLFLLLVAVFVVSFFVTERVQAADCVCGSAINSSHSTAPTSGLCATGNSSSVSDVDGYWNWTCGDGNCEEVSCQARKTAEVNTWCCVDDSKNPPVCGNPNSLGECTIGTKKTGACSTYCTGNNNTPIVPDKLAGLPTNPDLVKGIFTNVANFLLSIIGIIAIISFVISGIQYFLVATDEKMMEKAKKTMVYSIIGLVVALFGYIAIKTVEMLLKG